jgi:hypothetical protein
VWGPEALVGVSAPFWAELTVMYAFRASPPELFSPLLAEVLAEVFWFEV